MENSTFKKRFKALCNKNKLVSNALYYAMIVLVCSGLFYEKTSYYNGMSILILALGTGFLASWVQVKYPNKKCAR